jgi:hypothetical protein
MWDYLKPQLDLLGVKMVCVILEDKENEVRRASFSWRKCKCMMMMMMMMMILAL